MNILFVCTAGASTSFVVHALSLAVRKRGLDWTLDALPLADAAEVIGKYDLVMLAPQVRYQKRTLSGYADLYGVPIVDVDPGAYGRCDVDELITEIQQNL